MELLRGKAIERAFPENDPLFEALVVQIPRQRIARQRRSNGMQRHLDGKAYAEPQLNSMIRWMAVSILKAAPEDRGARYVAVRQTMMDAIDRFGLEGREAADCLMRNMQAVRSHLRKCEAFAARQKDAA